MHQDGPQLGEGAIFLTYPADPPNANLIPLGMEAGRAGTLLPEAIFPGSV